MLWTPDTTAAAKLFSFSRKIDKWIEDLQIYAKTAPELKFAQLERLQNSWSNTERRISPTKQR
jgi:hypothetical protein